MLQGSIKLHDEPKQAWTPAVQPYKAPPAVTTEQRKAFWDENNRAKTLGFQNGSTVKIKSLGDEAKISYIQCQPDYCQWFGMKPLMIRAFTNNNATHDSQSYHLDELELVKS